ncbi:MAG: spore germination protein [Eubacteriales bacterium]|nr:spore germination protein [Eubacteriales bacterium]
MQNISKELSINQSVIQNQLQNCDDILLRPMKLGRFLTVDCFLIYIETAVSNIMLEDSVIGKMLNHLKEADDAEIYEEISKNSLGVSDTKELASIEEAMAAMLAGNAVLFIDGYDKAIKIGSKGYPGAGVLRAESEKVLRGSKEAFSESVKVNSALIRKRVRDTRLKVCEKMIGRYSGTMTALLYMENLVYPPVLEEIKQRMKSFETDDLADGGVLEHLTADTWYSPFPQYQATERPDRAAMAVLAGQVVILTDNSPEALILPTTCNSLFQTSDDYYRHFAIVSFLRLIRYLSAFLAISLPGLYLAATNFHTQILPGNLIFSLAEARAGVPFPSIIEVLFLELSFELLREAGLRMPGPIGNTIGIVGGLIVGQAAVSANLVSPIVVVIVALTALGSFSIPNEELSESFRLLKYGMIVLCACFGVLGLLFGWFLLIVHLAGLKSFGISYLAPYGGETVESGVGLKDSIVRWPSRSLTKRPIFARKENRRKMSVNPGEEDGRKMDGNAGEGNSQKMGGNAGGEDFQKMDGNAGEENCRNKSGNPEGEDFQKMDGNAGDRNYRNKNGNAGKEDCDVSRKR